MSGSARETGRALARGALGGAFAAALIAMFDARWSGAARAAGPDSAAAHVAFPDMAVACLGVIAPLALVLSLGTAAAWRLLSPGRPASVPAWLAALRRQAAGRPADVAAFAPLVVLAGFAWSTSCAYLARAVMRLAVPPPLAGLAVAAGGLAAAAALATIALAFVPPLRRRLANASEDRPGFVDPATTGTFGLALAAALFALGVATGSPSGEGGFLGIWGVFKREELDLRAAGCALGIVLAALFATSGARSVRGRVAALLAIAPLAATIHAATALEREPDLGLQLDRSAPLSRVVVRLLRRGADRDGDGAAGLFGGGDCSDRDAAIGPHATEVLDNGVDEDCSGEDLTSARLAELAPDAPAPTPTVAEDTLPRDLNVVLVTIDTLRWDLGYAGNERPLSPNIDRLAARSTVYERAYSLASYTGKSVGPMLIGKYGSETDRNWGHFNKFGPRDTFLAERLQRSGMRTMGVHAHRYFDVWGGLERGFDVLDMAAAPPKDAPWDVDTKASGKELTDAALAVLARPENVAGRFFLWVHYLDPHADYLAHEEHDFGASARARYDGEVAYADQQVGRLLDAIAAAPWGGRTAIVVTSDHGEAFGENGMHRHGFEVWETLVRVPLVVHVPGAPAQRIAARRSLIDLAPTVLQLAHVHLPPKPAPPGADDPAPSGAERGDDFLSGTSLAAEVRGLAPAQPRDVAVDMPAGPYNDARRALIHGDLKLIVANDTRFDLFDLEADPTESKNLARTDEDRLKAMKDRYAAWKARLRAIEVTGKRK